MYPPDPNLAPPSEPDPDLVSGYSFGGIAPRSKVRLPDDVKKLRKRTRGNGYDDHNEEE